MKVSSAPLLARWHQHPPLCGVQGKGREFDDSVAVNWRWGGYYPQACGVHDKTREFDHGIAVS